MLFKMSPIIFILVGLPATGKSTWCKHFIYGLGHETKIISSDMYIEIEADELGITYDAAYERYSSEAVEQMNEDADIHLSERRTIIWDRTNLTNPNRQKILNIIPDEYIKIAVVFNKPSDVIWHERLASRPGKNIPIDVLKSMENNLTYPTTDDGFNFVIQGN